MNKETDHEWGAVIDLQRAVADLKTLLGYRIRLRQPDCKGAERERLEKLVENLPAHRGDIHRFYSGWMLGHDMDKESGDEG